MKRLKTIFACMLMALFSIGQVWATDYTLVYTLNCATASSNGTQSAYGVNSTTTMTGSGVKAFLNAAAGTTLISTDPTVSGSVYWAKGQGGGDIPADVLKIGKSSGGGSISFTIGGDDDITKVVIDGYVWKNTSSISVNSSDAQTRPDDVQTATSFTFENLTASKTIIIDVASSAVCITSIKLYKTASGGGGCTNTVAITRGAQTNGTYSLSAESVCGDGDGGEVSVTNIEAAPGYRFKEITTSASGTVNNTTKKVTGITAATTITVVFETIPTHTLNYQDGAGSHSKSSVEEGDNLITALGTPAASCDATSKTFVGWVTEEISGKTDDEPTFVAADAVVNATTAAATYYAVYAQSSASAFDGEHGGTFKIYAEIGNNKYYAGTYSSSKYSSTTDASDATDFEIAAVSDGFTIKDGNKYLTYNSSTNFGKSDDPYYWNIEAASTAGSWHITSVNTSARGFIYRASTYNVFGAYGSGNVNGTEYYDVEISGATSYGDYMTTCAACTHLDDAPELDGTIAVTHNTATINWKTLTNASSYDVTVIRNSDSESIFSGNVNALTKALTGLDPETQYDYSIMGVGDGSTYCTTGNGVLNGSFTTDAAPTAKLYLVQLKGEDPVDGGTHALGVEFDLPTSAATCGKTLVGWTTETYENYTHATTAPTVLLKKYTFASTDDVTLYAVYANVEEDDETITPSAVAEGDDPHAITINKSGYTLSANKNTGSTAPAWNSGASDVRIYAAGDITLTSTSTMTRIVFNLSTQGKKRLAPITASVGTIATQAANDETVTWTGSATSVTFTVGAAADYGSDGSTKAGQLCFSNIDVTVQGEFSNYSTTCVDAPVATPSPAALNDVAVAGASGTITMTYEHVNESGVAVSLWNNAACTEAFEGSWLTASLDVDKNITYTIAENTSYNDARSAYIRLIAPETSGAASPAVVKIPVSQVKKAPVFASIEELVAADVNANTNVTVTLTDVLIKEIYYYPNNSSEDNRKGIVFNVQKDNADVKIYFASGVVPTNWVAGGKVSGTLTDCPWKTYQSTWQLAPTSGWAWESEEPGVGLTYTAPPAIASIEIRGNATEKTYIDGQAFNPAGLEVIAIYDDNVTEEDVTSYATWTFDPAKLSESDTEVEVTAEYNNKSDNETITGLTVNPIPDKTIAQFIAAGGSRCYLEGTVSNITSTTYGNFDLTDASGTIYVFGCLTPSGESKKFDELGVEEGDQIKVIAEEYILYGTPAKDEAKNVVFVSKISAATIDIDDINMVEGEELSLSAIEATITPVAAQSATISYEVTDGDAVTIEEGKIKAIAEGDATITASIEAGEGYLAGSTTFTVSVEAAPVPFEGDYFVKVANNSDLTAGEYLIVYEDGSLAFDGSLGTLDGEGNTIAVTFDHGKIQGTDDVLAATFTIKLAGTIQSHSGYYIGQNSNANGLASSTEIQYNSAISIDASKNAVIESEGGAYLRYNSTSGQTRFRYFKSATYNQQQPIALYKKENAAPVYETVRTDLNEGEYYTMCLDKAVTAVQGGTIWRVVSKSDNTSNPGIILEDVELPLQAGRPYIFNATADKLEVVYNGAAVDDLVTEGNNGLVGSFEQASITADDNNYIIYNNALYFVNSDNVYVGANRAYLDMDGVPPYSIQGNAPGRRRVVMNVYNGNQMPTGIEGIEVSEAPRKVMIDGQLFILRDKKMYDASGRLVK